MWTDTTRVQYERKGLAVAGQNLLESGTRGSGALN